MSSGAGAKAAWHVASQHVLRDLQSLIGVDHVERLSFEEGEAAREAALARYKYCQRGGVIAVWQLADQGRLRLVTGSEIAARLKGDVLVFLQDSERRGVYHINHGSALRCAVELLEYDGSTIFLTDQDFHAGVLLDYEADNQTTPYEVEAWGPDVPSEASRPPQNGGGRCAGG